MKDDKNKKENLKYAPKKEIESLDRKDSSNVQLALAIEELCSDDFLFDDEKEWFFSSSLLT